MELAIEQALRAAANEEIPVGAVIICDGEVVAEAHNKDIELNDPTAHAEMLAIRQACEKLGQQRLTNCDMYVTLEPCPMCCAATSFARIRRLYYGASDPKSGGIEHFNRPNCHHKPEIYDGINETECSQLMKGFFSTKR